MRDYIVRRRKNRADIPTGEYIVRCGECKWYNNREGCFFSTAEIEAEDFCSYGERVEQIVAEQEGESND